MIPGRGTLKYQNIGDGGQRIPFARAVWGLMLTGQGYLWVQLWPNGIRAPESTHYIAQLQKPRVRAGEATE